MNNIKLGTHGPSVFPFALGCMGMSRMYGDSDDRESIATIHAALERGVNLIDTGDFYGQGHNELLVGKALVGKRDRAVLSVKYGAMRGPDGSWIGFDTRPAATKNFLAYSLTRLGVDHVDIYRPSRLDPTVPIEDTIGAIADLVKAGYVRHIGLSEVGAETLRRANAIHPIVDLQIEYSLISRGPEDKIFPTVQELGMAVTAYGILSRGLLTGAKPGANDFRQHLPRFAGDNLAKNQTLVDALAQLAARRGVTPAQLAIAWARTKYPFIVPLVGARTRKQLDDALGALSLELSADDIKSLESAIAPTAVAGSRYQEFQMKHLDSER
jgi:aryl-alcohol dehydrogenase-like predicted oxidoreductase